MKLRVVHVGERAPGWVDDALQTYRVRMHRFTTFEEASVRPETFRGDEDAVRKAESDRILATVTPRDRLIALDERGRSLDTRGFAALLDEGMQADGRLVLAIGGAYGHHERLRAAAWRLVRLSDLVLAHDVARVVLAEQVYRAFTVLRGMPYHHG